MQERTQVGSQQGVIVEGEDLLYEVTWWIFKIGQVRIKTLESKVRDGELRHTAVAFIDSYEGLPFVDLHAITYAIMDSLFYSHGTRFAEKKNNEWWIMNTEYDFSRNIVITEETRQKDLLSPSYVPSTYDTIAIDSHRMIDGLSILYFARGNVHTVQSVYVPTIIYKTVSSTLFHFSNKGTTVQIKALDKPIAATELRGKALYKGIFGFTGEFRGWFSQDEAAVPLKGKLRVILGSIDIELIKWERNNWTPPIRGN